MKKRFGIIAIMVVVLLTAGCSLEQKTEPPVPEYAVRGKVILPDGIEGDLSKTVISDTEEKLDVTVSADGTFTIDNLDKESDHVLFFNLTSGDTDYAARIEGIRPSDDPEEQVTVELERAWTLKGRAELQYMGDRKDHSGTTVRLMESPYTTGTDAEGNWILKGLPSGNTCKLLYTHEGQASSESLPFRMYASDATYDRELSFRPIWILNLHSGIYGKLYVNTDFSKAKVYATNEKGSTPLYPVSKDGSYMIEGLDEGIYSVYVTIERSVEACIKENINIPEGMYVQVDLGAPDPESPFSYIDKIDDGQVEVTIKGKKMSLYIGSEHKEKLKPMDSNQYVELLQNISEAKDNQASIKSFIEQISKPIKDSSIAATKGSFAFISALINQIDVSKCSDICLIGMLNAAKAFADQFNTQDFGDICKMDQTYSRILEYLMLSALNQMADITADGKIRITDTSAHGDLLAEQAANLCFLLPVSEEIFDFTPSPEILLSCFDYAPVQNGSPSSAYVTLFPADETDRKFADGMYQVLTPLMINRSDSRYSYILNLWELMNASYELFIDRVQVGDIMRNPEFNTVSSYLNYAVRAFVIELDALFTNMKEQETVTALENLGISATNVFHNDFISAFGSVYNATWKNQPEGAAPSIKLPAEWINTETVQETLNTRLANALDPDTSVLHAAFKDQQGNTSLKLTFDTLEKITGPVCGESAGAQIKARLESIRSKLTF